MGRAEQAVLCVLNNKWMNILGCQGISVFFFLTLSMEIAYRNYLQEGRERMVSNVISFTLAMEK